MRPSNMKFWVMVTSLLLSGPACFCLQKDGGYDEIRTRSKASFIDISKEGESIIGGLGNIFGFSENEISTVISITKIGLGVADMIRKLFQKNFNGTDSPFSTIELPNGDKKLLSMFKVITHRLDEIQIGMDGTEASLRDLVRGLPHMVRWEVAVDTMEEYTRPINNLFHRFSYYQTNRDEIEDLTLLNFAESVVSHDSHSIQSLMANIHSMAAPSDPPVLKAKKHFARDEYEVYNRVTSELSNNLRRTFVSRGASERDIRDTMAQLSLRPSIFIMLKEAIENYNFCSLDQSPQQLIFGVYTLLAVTQAKAYAMVRFSYELLRYYEEGNFTIERRLSEELYNHYSKGILTEARKALIGTSNGFRKCDPKAPKEGENFEMITELLQGYIENEVDLNVDGTCRKNCGYYEHADIHGCFSSQSQFCGKQKRCKGRVHNCRFFEADAHVCLSNATHRRYDWIEYEGGTVVGRKGADGSCDSRIKVDSWWRFFVHCSYCVCLCDDASSDTSDRFVSLLASVADVKENKVVTGLRFTKKNRVMHIQVQEAGARPQGQVDPNSKRWRGVLPIDIMSTRYRNGMDYATLRYEARNIDLDRLVAPKNHVVTGLRLRMLGPHVNLEMWVTPIDFTTGKLTPELSYWISNDNTPARNADPRRELFLSDPDDPRRSNLENTKDGIGEAFVALQGTSMYKDVAQLTVPFFDTQRVSPTPSTWLKGVELYHRGRKGYGGYFGFEVYNYNITRHFEEEDFYEIH